MQGIAALGFFTFLFFLCLTLELIDGLKLICAALV